MKKMKKIFLLFISITIISSLWSTCAFAGERTTGSSYSNDGTSINAESWTVSDENVICQDEKLVILKSSTEETKFISKQIAQVDNSVENIISVSGTMTIKTLPKGKKLVFALGLQSIDAALGEEGNIEIVLTNQNGIQLSVYAQSESGTTTVLKSSSCGIALNQEFAFFIQMSSDSRLQIKVNDKDVCAKKTPVNGEGRFGILQTGGCSLESSQLTVETRYYDRPENTNIEEDFEDGEWNANLLYGQIGYTNRFSNSTLQIEDYKGSKVLMFRGAVGYIGTVQQFSNFELTFDVPYILRDNVYNEEGIMIDKRCYTFGIGFGEEKWEKYGAAYETNVDLITFNPVQIHSELARKFTVRYKKLDNLFDVNSNDGFSVKFTVVDGNATLKVKALGSDTWQEVATVRYEDFRTGYVSVWNPGNGNFAIDNLKIVNLDREPNQVEVEYKTSILTVEDYEWTEEDAKMVYKENPEEDKKTADTKDGIQINYFVLGGIVAGVLIVGALCTILIVKKRNKKRDGGEYHEMQ